MRRVVNDAMRSYYDRRADQYDDWWLGTGLFADRARPGWAEEVERLVAVVSGLQARRVLDVACGTGFLTRHLRGDVVALDQSAGMLALTRERIQRARLVQGDAVPLPFADGTFDLVFTGHFYGHLLPEERAPFLAEVQRVGRELVVVDAAVRDDTPREDWPVRTLDDGSRHRIYKRFFDPDELVEEIGGGSVLHSGRWFVVVRT
jgi:ubiquinone/menaquinone biosynthesis C-methylase UbiE